MSLKTSTPYGNPDFAEFVTDLKHDSNNQKLTAVLAEVTNAGKDNNKDGELTLKDPNQKGGNDGDLAVHIRKKLPGQPLHGTLVYIADNGELLREDARQLRLKGLENRRQHETLVAELWDGHPHSFDKLTL